MGVAASSATAGGEVVDHVLHGLLRVRLIGADQRQRQAAARRLGSPATTAEGDADLTVRFVDRLDRAGSVRRLGAGGGSFDDARFLVSQPTTHGEAFAELPLGSLAPGCELRCERGLAEAPMLVPLLNLLALAKGVVALHASAFVFEGTGIAAAGWRTSGKTETLLAFLAEGATAIADEWVYVTPDGGLHGVPEPVRLQDWHLDQYPTLASSLTRRDRLRLRALRSASAAIGAVPRRAPGRRAVRAAASAIDARRHADVEPSGLVAPERWVGRGQLDRLFLVLHTDGPGVRVEPTTGDAVAERMVFAHQHHRLGAISRYWASRFAFPDRVGAVLEDAEATERRLLRAALSPVAAYTVEHPHPVPMPEVFRAMRPYC